MSNGDNSGKNSGNIGNGDINNRVFILKNAEKKEGKFEKKIVFYL